MPPPLRIVLADDTDDLRSLLRLSLERSGDFTVVAEVGNGADAVTAVERERPDAIVLDATMPVLDGLQAISPISARSPETCIVLLSAVPHDRLEEHARARGAHACLEKGEAFTQLGPLLLSLCRGDGSSPAEAPPMATSDVGSELLSFMVHELRTPLTVILGLAETIEENLDGLDREMLVKGVGAIARSARNLDALLVSFADARAVEAGRLQLATRPTDLATVVHDAASVEGRPVTVSAPAGVEGDVDPHRIGQVVSQLVSNAAKFSPPGAPIEVRLEANAEDVAVAVRDEGPGIPAERRAEVFAKFSRLDPRVPGAGLGLFIARGIARAHGGDVEIADVDGPGTEVRMTLPRR